MKLCYFLLIGSLLSFPIIQQNSFKGLNFITIPFNFTNNQIKITMDSYPIDHQESQTFLFICFIKPTLSTFMQLLKEDKCFVNWFSYQMKLPQYLVLQRQSSNKLISNYYQIYQYNESSYIGFQSTYEANIIVRVSQLSSNQCILDCQNNSECKYQICKCNLYQIGQDCNIIIDDLTKQQIFQGGKSYYVDILNMQKQNEEILLKFQNSTSFYGFCITQNFNQNLISRQTNNTLYISIDQIKECYQSIQNIQEQQNSSINFYYLVYFDSNNLIYLESPFQSTDNQLLIIVLSTILSLVVICLVVCVIKTKCFKKKKQAKKSIQDQDLRTVPNIIDQFFPSQEFQGFRNKCEKFISLNQCLICLDVFYDDSLVRVTYCNHIFHTSCLDRWMNIHKNCPNCRSSFEQESILKYYNSNKKDSDTLQWSSRTEEIKVNLRPLINETQHQQPQVSQLDSQRNIQAF